MPESLPVTESGIPIVERLFTEQAAEPGLPLPFQMFLDKPSIVVLGDPGAGKTTAFQGESSLEPGALCVTVRDFVALDKERYRGKILYLDALDEMRSKAADGRSVLDQVRGRLDELGCPRFRLSCRAADWYGKSDIKSLEAVSQDQKIVVLELEPLSDSDIRIIISSQGFTADEFIGEAKRHGIYELLDNPQTLMMVIAAVKGRGSWPGTRHELFQSACEVLSKEQNDEHRLADQDGLSVDALLRAAGQLFAIMLCSGAEGIALDDGQSSADFFSLSMIGDNRESLLQVTQRRLFRAGGTGRFVPVHRTIAEYLAGRYLSDRIGEGLPFKRVLALITGQDGGTLSDTRGLFAWFACICRQHAEALISIDPLSVVSYGDAALLSLASKQIVIRTLCDRARGDSSLRSENWSSRPLGALSVPEMEAVFREILMDRSQRPVALSFVLDAICYGQPIPGLGDLLMQTVRDRSVEAFLREDALEAFANNCPARVDDMRELLSDIYAGSVRDGRYNLRAYLLRKLYPGVIGPADILAGC